MSAKFKCTPDTSTVKSFKTIDVYLNGYPKDFYKVHLHKTRKCNWYHVLCDISNKINPYFGKVEKLYTSDSGITVNSFSELEDGGSYVASDFRKFKLVKGGYVKLPKNSYFEHYLSGQLNRHNREKKLNHVNEALIVIYVFNNGKHRDPPVKFVLSKEDLKNWEYTMSFMALIMDLPSRAIRSLYNRNGTKVCGPWELQHGATYIAVGYDEAFIKREYKISEDITEIWKNGIPVVQKHKNQVCKHKEIRKSWDEPLNWKPDERCHCEKTGRVRHNGLVYKERMDCICDNCKEPKKNSIKKRSVSLCERCTNQVARINKKRSDSICGRGTNRNNRMSKKQSESSCEQCCKQSKPSKKKSSICSVCKCVQPKAKLSKSSNEQCNCTEKKVTLSKSFNEHLNMRIHKQQSFKNYNYHCCQNNNTGECAMKATALEIPADKCGCMYSYMAKQINPQWKSYQMSVFYSEQNNQQSTGGGKMFETYKLK